MIFLTLFCSYFQVIYRAVKEYEIEREDRDLLIWNACLYPSLSQTEILSLKALRY